MEYFKRVKSTVSQNLPGNPITREYDVKEFLGTIGPESLWKIYSAAKKSTKQEAAVWIMEKKQLDQFGKNSKEFTLEFFKRGIQNLTRIRHPKIISVVNPLEESRESLCFATEPIFTSLASVLNQNANLTPEVIEKLSNFELHDVEIKHGVLQILDALAFLHYDCKQIHGNICPNSIVINRLGCWKLAGLEFLTNINEEDPFHTKFDHFIEHDLSALRPYLPFCSPELAIDGFIGSSADMYAIGMLIYCLHNQGKLLNNCGDSIFEFKKKLEYIKDLSSSSFISIPDNMREYAFMLVNHNPRVRPDAYQLKKASYFSDPSVTALQNLDDLYQLDNLGKSQFYKTLPQLISNMPKRICIYRILPQLCEEFSNPNMIPFVLPSVLLILDLSDQMEFNRNILPKIIPVLAMKEPPQILLIWLQNLKIILKKISKEDFSIHCLPLICSSLDTDDRNITQLCLDSLPEIGEHLDFKVMKSHIFPKMKKLCINTNLVPIKLAVLICIAKLLQYADKWFVIDDILPFLPDVKCRDPSVLISIYGLYRIILNHRKLGLNREAIANKVLPNLIPLSIDLNLNLKQYQAFADLIRDLCKQLEKNQQDKLKQSGKVNEDIDAINLNTSFLGEIDDASQAMNDIMQTYTGKPFDSKSPKSNNGSYESGALVPSNMSLDMYDQLLARAQNDQESIRKALPMSSKPKDLSMEDKRKMIINQQQSRITYNSSDNSRTIPKALPQVESNNQGMDLSHTLINKNLNDLSLTQPKALPWNGSSVQSQPNYLINCTPSAMTNNLNQFMNSCPVYNSKTIGSLNPWPPQMPNATVHGERPQHASNFGPLKLPQQNIKQLSKSDINDLLG